MYTIKNKKKHAFPIGGSLSTNRIKKKVCRKKKKNQMKHNTHTLLLCIHPSQGMAGLCLAPVRSLHPLQMYHCHRQLLHRHTSYQDHHSHNSPEPSPSSLQKKVSIRTTPSPLKYTALCPHYEGNASFTGTGKMQMLAPLVTPDTAPSSPTCSD